MSLDIISGLVQYTDVYFKWLIPLQFWTARLIILPLLLILFEKHNLQNFIHKHTHPPTQTQPAPQWHSSHRKHQMNLFMFNYPHIIHLFMMQSVCLGSCACWQKCQTVMRVTASYALLASDIFCLPLKKKKSLELPLTHRLAYLPTPIRENIWQKAAS